MRNFKELEIWEEAHKLTLEVYRVTSEFPPEEKFGIISQMRRSASSIPMNIAEGCGRGTDKELKRFCEIAMGSASELEYQLILINDLSYLDERLYLTLSSSLVVLKKRLNSFIQFLKTKIPTT